MSPASQPAVAIIMRSKNEMPYTEAVFDALDAQTYRNFVLYNVDSGSTDGTIELVHEKNTDRSKIIEIAPDDYVPGKVLNMMIEQAAERIIVFLNADAIPQSNQWLENLLQPILSGEVDGTMSRQVAREDAHFIVKQDYIRAYDPIRFPGGILEDFFSAVACAFKKELWEETKFYTTGYAEDLAWCRECQAKGRRFKLVADSVVEHSHNYSLKGLYRKRYRQGVAFGYIYGTAPNGLARLYQVSKEIIRDTINAVKDLQPHTIPYNLLYRSAIHLGYHQGNREGLKRYRNK
ncbi:MAG: glycosyltransferase family A protein [Chlamydiales bacterium]|nr:glycosyltransferase family A protein [Chlamydiales bacterium]